MIIVIINFVIAINKLEDKRMEKWESNDEQLVLY